MQFVDVETEYTKGKSRSVREGLTRAIVREEKRERR